MTYIPFSLEGGGYVLPEVPKPDAKVIGVTDYTPHPGGNLNHTAQTGVDVAATLRDQGLDGMSDPKSTPFTAPLREIIVTEGL